ncbi:MAG: FecR domain-containing protein [Thermomonas sp.]|uniref:FecR family protein n=1 Tax=Thermomonas sp. TaxID=1971895 RepID=UPI0039E58642
MDTSMHGPADEPLLLAASQWWLRLREASAKDADAVTGQWLEWSAADPAHAEAFGRVAELAAQVRTLDGTARSALAAEFAPRAKAPVRRHWVGFAAAAALVLALAGSVLFRPEPVAEQRFASQVAENRELRLDDGSQVALGGASVIVARFGRDRRDIELEAGEAFFQVAHDTQRPFVVSSGRLSVRAVGTAFNVRRDGERVRIDVAEGRVRIAGSGEGADAEAIEAVAGQQVAYDPDAHGMRVRNIDPARVGTWRALQLEFVNEPLASVVNTINRYRLRPLRIEDTAVGALSFTGTVQLDNLDGWLGALPHVFPVRVVDGKDAVVLVAHAGAENQARQ